MNEQRSDSLLRRFAVASSPSAIERGGEIYIPLADAIKAVQYVGDHDFIVLGMEGFRLRPDRTEPLLDHIANLSGIGGSHAVRVMNSVAEAVRILSDWSEPEYVALGLEVPEDRA